LLVIAIGIIAVASDPQIAGGPVRFVAQWPIPQVISHPLGRAETPSRGKSDRGVPGFESHFATLQQPTVVPGVDRQPSPIFGVAWPRIPMYQNPRICQIFSHTNKPPDRIDPLPRRTNLATA